MNLDDIIMYWRMNRGAGHTHASLHGVGSKKCIVVVLNRNTLVDVQRQHPNAIVLCISEPRDRLFGLRLPLVVDHAAMAQLCYEEQERLYRMSHTDNLPYRGGK